jgi:hypothetical protein
MDSNTFFAKNILITSILTYTHTPQTSEDWRLFVELLAAFINRGLTDEALPLTFEQLTWKWPALEYPSMDGFLSPPEFLSAQKIFSAQKFFNAQFNFVSKQPASTSEQATKPLSMLEIDHSAKRMEYGIDYPSESVVASEQTNMTVDSGYGSKTSASSKETYTNSFTGAHTSTDQTTLLETLMEDDDEERDRDMYSASTVYSASVTSTLPAPQDDGYIDELAGLLYDHVDALLPERAALQGVCDQLPDILRSFALRFGNLAQTQMHRDVCFFVHKLRL